MTATSIHPFQIPALFHLSLGRELSEIKRVFDLEYTMSTSKLQEYTARKLSENFGHLKIYENYRPDWLRGSDLEILELDFYIPELNLAIEVQGAQHYQYVEFFHQNLDNFNKTKERDRTKIDVCEGRGINLLHIYTEQDVDVFVRDIKDKDNKDGFGYVPLDMSYCYFEIKKVRDESIQLINGQKTRKKPLTKNHRINRVIAEYIFRCLNYGVNIIPEVNEFYQSHREFIDYFLSSKINGKILQEKHKAEKELQ